MAEENFPESAPNRPSLRVSLPVELFNKRLRELSYISCPEVTSTTGDYYGVHCVEDGWNQAFNKGRNDYKNLEKEGNNNTQQNIPDSPAVKIKEEQNK